MNREVHVRFWESPEVKVLRATRQLLRFDGVRAMSGPHQIASELEQHSGRRHASRRFREW